MDIFQDTEVDFIEPYTYCKLIEGLTFVASPVTNYET